MIERWDDEDANLAKLTLALSQPAYLRGWSKVFRAGDAVSANLTADEASAIVFVDFDAGDGWLAGLAPEQEKADVEPLSALGLSAWRDDSTQHAVLRLTTD